MITRYWRWIKSAALALLAGWGIWTAWRALDRGSRATHAGSIAESAAEARAAHARANELNATAVRKRFDAMRRIEQIRANGDESMAQKLEKMNAL